MYDTFQDTSLSMFWDNLEYLDRTEIIDKYTLRFHMKRPVMFFDQVMASSFYYIFAREHLENRQVWDAWVIGTGPYMLQYHKFQDHFEGIRHPKFTEIDRGGFRQPYVDKLYAPYRADDNVTKAMYRSQQIDYMRIPDLTVLDDMLATNPESTVNIIPQDPNVHTMYAINWKNPVWGASEAGLKMRRALSMSIDRKGLTDLILGGAGVPSYATPYDFQGLKAPVHWDDLGQYYVHNIPEAKRLMAEAGYPNGYDLELLVSATPSASQIAMQQQMAEAGFRLTFNQKESTVVTNIRNEKTFKDLVSGSQDSGYDMEMNIYRLWAGPDAIRNYASVDDKILADLAQKQRYELDYNKRLEIARQVHARYLEIIPLLHVTSAHRMTVRHPWMKNWGDNIHSWLCCWGSQSSRQVMITDEAPGGRGGTRGKEGTWGVPYDRQGHKV
jgi:peptide/nickel transport system substrate-binding protein